MSSEENEEVVRRTSSSARRRKIVQIEDNEDEDEEVSIGNSTINASESFGTGREHVSWRRGLLLRKSICLLMCVSIYQ